MDVQSESAFVSILETLELCSFPALNSVARKGRNDEIQFDSLIISALASAQDRAVQSTEIPSP